MNRTQEVELTNMCFIYDENRILVYIQKRRTRTGAIVEVGVH